MVSFECFEKQMVKQKIIETLFFAFILAFFFGLTRPAILGQLGGTFKAKNVPEEYIVLKDFLWGQKENFGVLWVPKHQRFGFWSSTYPAFSVSDWIEDDRCLEPFCSLKLPQFNRQYFACHPNEKCYPADASFLANPATIEELRKMGVKYIIIPFDSEGEIFLYERRYDEEARWKLEGFLDTIPWLKKVEVVDKIEVYELPESLR